MHRTLFGFAVAVSAFGTLFADEKSVSRTPDLVIFSSGACLFLASLVVAFKNFKTESSAAVWSFFAAGGLLFCLYTVAGVVRHIH